MGIKRMGRRNRAWRMEGASQGGEEEGNTIEAWTK